MRLHALIIASTFLGLSATNPTSCLKLLDHPENIEKVVNAIVNNEITPLLFSEILEDLDTNLRKHHGNFLLVVCVQTPDRKRKTRSVDNNMYRRARITQDNAANISTVSAPHLRPTEDDNDRILTQILADNNHLGYFIQHLQNIPGGYLELFHFYQAIINFATKSVSQSVLANNACCVISEYLDPSKEYFPLLDASKVGEVEQATKGNYISTNLFNVLKEEIEMILEEQCMIKFGQEFLPKSKRKKKLRLGFKKK